MMYERRGGCEGERVNSVYGKQCCWPVVTVWPQCGDTMPGAKRPSLRKEDGQKPFHLRN